MLLRVAVYGIDRKGGSDKSTMVGAALRKGFLRHGVECHPRHRFDPKEGVIADVALCYGWINELSDKLFSRYQEAGKHFVFFDLGYWDRGPEGHYRLGIDDWDTAKYMRRGCPSDRFNSLGVNLRNDWNKNSDIVMVVGMSGKAAWTHGYKEGEWESAARTRILSESNNKYYVYVRMKPNRSTNKNIEPLDTALKEARFAVCHHSNVAVDCLVAGVPFYAKKGVGSLISPPDFNIVTIEKPYFPPEAEKMQLLYDVAYAQWKPEEMRNGHCWEYIRGVLGL